MHQIFLLLDKRPAINSDVTLGDTEKKINDNFIKLNNLMSVIFFPGSQSNLEYYLHNFFNSLYRKS